MELLSRIFCQRVSQTKSMLDLFLAIKLCVAVGNQRDSKSIARGISPILTMKLPLNTPAIIFRATFSIGNPFFAMKSISFFLFISS